MRTSWRTYLFLFSSVFLLVLGAGCPGGQIMYGAYGTEELIEGSDETAETTTSIDFSFDGGEDLTIDIPCEDMDQIVSRDVTVRSLASANFVSLDEEIVDYGDGNCGLSFVPMGDDGFRWMGEPQACDRFLADARIEIQAYRTADTLNSKASTLDQTRTLTASREFLTACPYSIEMGDALGNLRGVAIGGNEEAGRMYLASDVATIDSYAKLLEGFDTRSPELSKLFTRPQLFAKENQSVAVLVDKDSDIVVDLTYDDNKCYVKAYEVVSGVRMWSQTLADDSVDSYECIDAYTPNLVVLERLYLAEWGLNPRYAVRVLDISNGEEISRTVIDPVAYGYETFWSIKPGPNDSYLVLASVGGVDYLLKADLSGVPVLDVVAKDTDYTRIKDFAYLDGYIYTLEEVFKADGNYTVATLIRRTTSGDVLAQAELGASYLYQDDGLDAVALTSSGDYIYVTANNSSFGVIAKILKQNMSVVWERYAPFANIYSAAKIDELSGDVVMMGATLDGRITIPKIFRISIYGRHFGGVFVDDLDTLKVLIDAGGGVIPDECPPASETCIPLTHL